MNSDQQKHPLTLDLRLIGALRQDLTGAQWNTDFLDWFFGEDLPQAFNPENIALGRHQLARYPEKPAALLSRLFQFGDKLSHRSLQIMFPKLGIKGAQKLGIIKAVNKDQTRFRATVHLEPHGVSFQGEEYQWWVASDLPEAITGQALPADHVLGIGGATRSLLHYTCREPVGRSLDLGTGCGIQALYLALHSQEVVATDISTRAVQYGRFNAALAGAELAAKISFRPGSFWDPIAGETFDLIVSNPPFVITPPQVREQTGLWEYRDGGRAGDGVMAFLLRTIPNYLNSGGYAQLLGNWEVNEETAWFAHPQKWLADLPADYGAQIVLRELQLPTAYANLWLRDGGIDLRTQRREHQVALQNWVGYFEAQEVAAIAFGYLFLHRLPQVSASIADPIGQSAEQIWFLDARQTALSATGADMWKLLLNHRYCLNAPAPWQGHWQVAGDVSEQRYYQPGQPDPTAIHLVQGNTWGLETEVSALLAGLVGACDGELSLRQIVEALAQLVGSTTEQVQAEVAAGLDYLIQGGFLLAPNTVPK